MKIYIKDDDGYYQWDWESQNYIGPFEFWNEMNEDKSNTEDIRGYYFNYKGNRIYYQEQYVTV